MVSYQVGGIDEVNGVTGVAHVLEHMMFKGTPTVAAGEYSRLISEAGGRENAFTSNDFTGYFAMLQKSQLELALRLEADRMTNITLAAEEFAKEIKVVMEERRWRTDDRPRSLVYEQLMATALTAHPYRNPVIGWMSDLESMRVEDARDFYRRWYTPNNATLVWWATWSRRQYWRSPAGISARSRRASCRSASRRRNRRSSASSA